MKSLPNRQPSKALALLVKGPAYAGLFFALSGVLWAEPRLSAAGQAHFRRFIEAFTPLVVRYERRDRRLNYRWHATGRDCAGLIRYVFYEALVRHDEAFFSRYPELARIGNYPNPGEFSAVQSVWSSHNSTAPELLHKARYLNRTATAASLKSGDIFYYESAEWRIRHAMLVLRAGSRVFLVYHTGDARNELRLRTLEDLRQWHEPQWHPEPGNPVFRGVYRPFFLD